LNQGFAPTCSRITSARAAKRFNPKLTPHGMMIAVELNKKEEFDRNGVGIIASKRKLPNL
jgi:hypothetical protein